VVSALAAGPGAVVTGARPAAAAATAAGAGKPVWAVVGRGVLLPGPLWDQLLERAGAAIRVIEAAKLEAVVGDQGLEASRPALSRPTCPPVAELLGWKS
jgi:hypothetical protein